MARYDKIHLFQYSNGINQYDEPRHTVAGQHPVVIDLPMCRAGLSTCYDLRFPELYRTFGAVDLIVVPSAFTVATGQAHWEILLRARAIENQAYVLAPAQAGTHASGMQTWGHSMFIDPWGVVLAELSMGPAVLIGELEHGRLADVRSHLPALNNRVLGTAN
jgi:nitrilase